MKQGATWNQLEPAKTTWNHLKAAILKYFFNWLKLFSGCICPNTPSLKCFLGKFGSKNWSSSNWLKFGTVACVCVCVFISFHRKGFYWLNKTINVMPEIRPAMLCWGNGSVSSTFVSTSLTIIAGTIRLETMQECQLNRAEPREVKENS